MRRNKLGMKSSELWNWEIEDFSKLTGPLAHQEYIQYLIRKHSDNPDNINKIIDPPKLADINLWQYEHIRQFIIELNLMITMLKGSCNEKTCPEIKINLESYNCNAHKNEINKKCCAINYMIHNLDEIMEEILKCKRLNVNEEYLKNFKKYLIRMYRMICHCYYSHKDIFDELENEFFILRRFTLFCIKFEYMRKDDIKISLNNL